jgi:hypothetical protein
MGSVPSLSWPSRALQWARLWAMTPSANQAALAPRRPEGATFIDGKLHERRPAETEPEVAETGSLAT